MKDWCKIIETNEFDILIQKSYSEEDDKYQIDIYQKVYGANATYSLGFSTEEKREMAWYDIEDEKYIKIARTVRNELLGMTA